MPEKTTNENPESVDDLIGSIMDEIDTTETKTDEVTSEEATKETGAETAPVEETTEEAVIQAESSSNNEFNKTEAIKALKEKLKSQDSIIKELKETKEVATSADSAVDADEAVLLKLGEAIGKTPSEIKEALKFKEAQAKGITVEAMDEIKALKDKVDGFEADRVSADAKAQEKKLANSIDSFIDETGIHDEALLKNFFVESKDKYGMDFIKNPNPEAMKALFKGAFAEQESYKKSMEQKVLQEIKNGESPALASDLTETQKTQTKKEKENWDKQVDSWIAQASK